MVDQKTPNAPRVRIWPFAVFAALFAYLFSRGPDGQLLASLVGFGVLGLVYCTLMWFSGHVSVIRSLSHFAIMELAVITALAINPELEEMGGILNYLIPVMVAIIVGIGWLVPLSRGLFGRRS